MYICIYRRILFHFQASKFSMYVGIAISTLPTGIATVPDKHAHVSYSPLSNTPIYQAVSHTYHSPRSFHSNHKGILDLTKQGNIYHDLVDHPLIHGPRSLGMCSVPPLLHSMDWWIGKPKGHHVSFFTIWLFNSSPWKITMLLIGKPSISMGHFPWLC